MNQVAPPKILVVDDEESMRFFLREALCKQNYEVDSASDGKEALDLAHRVNYDCVIMDIRMARMNGIETLQEMRKIHPEVPVIMMTAYGSRQVAIETIQKGAYDFFSKPFDLAEMRIVVKRALEKKSLESENNTLRRQIETLPSQSRIVTRCPLMKDVFNLIDRVLKNDVTVFVDGESGTGKELVATIIHEQGTRKDAPLVKINCAAIPDTLLESELFGHEKGAFTGAAARKIGKFEAADGGTLFLDEIGDMSLMTQAKLLRVLEEHAFERLGGNESIKVDIRIIAATNQDLARLVQEKRFREDLYFRLNVVPIHIPPLRARKEDIPLLVEHFIEDANRRFVTRIRAASGEVMGLFMQYEWPGNVRELMNVIQRAVVVAQSDTITEECLPSAVRNAGSLNRTVAGHESTSFDGSLQQMIEAISSSAERQLIEEALNRTNWSRTKTAKLLKICRKSLHNKMKKYGLLDKDDADDED